MTAYLDSEGVTSSCGGAWHSYAIHGCSASMAAAVVEPGVGVVIVENHLVELEERTIERASGWVSARVPLSRESARDPRLRLVRGLRFDIAMPVDEFLEAVAELTEGGLQLVQASSLPRETYPCRDSVPVAHWPQLFSAFGLMLHMSLPHRDETAVVGGPDRSVIEASRNRVWAAIDAL